MTPTPTPHTAALSALIAAASLSPALVAQDPCPRPVQQWSNVTGTNNTNDVQVSAPQDFVAGTGLPSSAQLVHLTYEVEDDAAGNVESIAYRQSTDGGCSFGPEQILWTGVAGESVDFHRVVSSGNQVYVFVETNRNSLGATSGTVDYCWVVASDQQGNAGTFQTTLVSTGLDFARTDGTQLGDVDAVVAAAGNGRAYTAFEAAFQNDGSGSSTNNGGIFFQSVSFVGGALQLDLAEEARLETYSAGQFDADFPLIAADGDLVTVTWQDPRGGIDNEQMSRTSTDGGTSFQAEVNHSNFAVSISSELSFVEVDGTSVYVLMTDERNTLVGAEDEAILAISNMSGAPGSFTEVVVSATPSGMGFDVDIAQIAADDGNVYVVYEDNRGGSDDWYVRVSNNSGAEFLSGTAAEVPLTTGGAFFVSISNSRIPTGVAVDDRAAFVYQTGSGGAGNLLVAVTADGGASWETCTANDAGFSGGDNDDRSMALTTRGELVVAMEDDRTGVNQTFTTGLRLPLLSYDDVAGQFELRGASPSAASQQAFLLTSFLPPVCNSFPIDVFNGWQSDFVIDAFTSAFLSVGGASASIDINGNAIFVYPNFAAMVGIPLYHAAFQFDFLALRTTGLSDTIVVTP
ncbi:MAG: hypothetical protein AAF196_20340 [Planctomycetota bacterium]